MCRQALAAAPSPGPSQVCTAREDSRAPAATTSCRPPPSWSCNLSLLQPYLFHKEVCLVIETIIFHALSVGLVEWIPSDVHPLHLISEPALDVSAKLLAPLGLEGPSPL